MRYNEFTRSHGVIKIIAIVPIAYDFKQYKL